MNFNKNYIKFKKIGNYILKETIGKGSFSKVKLALNIIKNEFYAIKIIKKSLLKKQIKFINQKFINSLQSIYNEIKIHKSLNHPNIIKLIETIDNDESDKLYIILELANNNNIIIWNEKLNIYQISEKFNQKTILETQIRQIMRDCLKGLYYLKENKIIHRDIKPENILFDTNLNVKIADFSISKKYYINDLLNDTNGTYYYMSPECFEHKSMYSGLKSDIWSLGATIYTIIYLIYPFSLKQRDKKKYSIKFPKKPIISKDLKKLLKNMMLVNFNKRINLNQIIQNQWINYGYSIDLKKEIRNYKINIWVLKFIKKLKDSWGNMRNCDENININKIYQFGKINKMLEIPNNLKNYTKN